MSQEVSARVQDLLDQASACDLGKEKHSLLVEAFQLAQKRSMEIAAAKMQAEHEEKQRAEKL